MKIVTAASVFIPYYVYRYDIDGEKETGDRYKVLLITNYNILKVKDAPSAVRESIEGWPSNLNPGDDLIEYINPKDSKTYYVSARGLYYPVGQNPFFKSQPGAEISSPAKSVFKGKDEIVPSSEMKSHPDFFEGNEYEEELRETRLEKIDKELSLKRKSIVIKRQLQNVLKKYRAIKYTQDPAYDKSELPSLEDAIKRLVKDIKVIQGKLNWYSRSQIGESSSPDEISEFEKLE